LCIDNADNGSVLLHCFSGCPPQSIMAAWGLTLADLMPGVNVDRRGRAAVRTVTLAAPAPTPTRPDLALLAQQYRTAVNPARLQRLAAALGLSVASLQRLGVGWATDSGAWAFPMTDAGGIVRGIRLRLDNGRKFSVVGGREGIFLPLGLPDAGELLIAEGASDTAALLDFGFAAIGRPSCRGGVGLLVDFIQAHKPSAVTICADADKPGQDGAEHLAAALAMYCPRVRLITPPPPSKDARAWRQAGATRADIEAAIAAAPVRKLSVTIQGGHHAG
jgi:hypothetical protein